MTYEQALNYLDSLNKFGIQLGLARIRKLLTLMGQPQQSFKSVHVTGTNGKGSTTAMLASILKAGGIKTAMYTSPHLCDYTERFQINGLPVSREVFADCVAHTKQYVQQMIQDGWEHPTQFEVLTAAAFYCFAWAKVEYAVIEVGLGGLLDSTNVIMPELAIITNVSLEHTDRCGSTIEEIAKHKAGIIKTGIPVVTAVDQEALPVIESAAKDRQAIVYLLGRDFSVDNLGINHFRQQLQFCTNQGSNSVITTVNLIGHHQVTNSALAIMAAYLLAKQEYRINWRSIANGLTEVSWPARFEILNQQPAVIIDGAHNPAGAKVLRHTLNAVFSHQPIIFVLGILQDKDISGIIRELITQVDTVMVVAPISDRAARPEKIAREIKAKSAQAYASIEDGIAAALQEAGASGIICVAGSLYLAGEARRILLENFNFNSY